jgi:hypothetical protein
MKSERTQASICAEFGSEFVPPDADSKVGIALSSLGKEPLNALRHPPEGSTCGWYIWGGEELSEDVDFFQPLHVRHLVQHCPAIVPYLALAPGWRVLLAPGQEDVWYDTAILSV